MQCAIVIPARMASPRFPGKPLCDLCGKPMVQWVYHAAVKSGVAEAVIIASPDEEILSVARAFGAHAVKTRIDHPSGTDRIAEVAESVIADFYVNVQGDEPLIDSESIHDVVALMFIAGDLSQPVVIGGIWSKTDSSPEPNEDGKNNFRGYRSRSGHRLILDDSGKTKVVIADKTAKNMFGIGEFDQDGAGPNVCAPFKPPMSGTSGVSFSSMEGTMEITCKNGKLLIEASQNIKINAKTTIAMKVGGDLNMEASSSAKLTSGSPSNVDASTTNIA